MIKIIPCGGGYSTANKIKENLEMKVSKTNERQKKPNIYELFEMPFDELRKLYNKITGLNNDDEFTEEEIFSYLVDVLFEIE